MDDLGNIIYVVIAIGWFFWNAYKKTQQEKPKKVARKQTSAPQPSTTGRTNSDPFKSLEEMILEQVEGRTEREPVLVETEVKRHKNQDKFLNVDLDHSHLPADYKMSEGEKGSHRVQRQVEPMIKEPKEPELSVMDELFPDGFDLRKAVVLNAILERPYA